MTDVPALPVAASRLADSDTVSRFPCDNCGADLRFTPGAAELTCTHCGHVQQIAHATRGTEVHREIDYDAMIAGQVAPSDYVETRVLLCPSCGAQTDLHESIQSARCPFCDTPAVADSGAHRFIKPAALIPFALDEKTAQARMRDWLGRIWFAPNGFRQFARTGRAMHGIYVPYWTFDARTISRYSGERGKKRGDQPVSWKKVSGQVARDFDDTLVLASHSLPRKYTNALEPWDLTALTTFQPAYLAGFGAEGYQVTLEDGFSTARARMRTEIESDVRRDIGGDEQKIITLDTDYGNVTFKHVLLPVWMAVYKYRGQTYRFVVNGQTGRVEGERPWSKWKIAFVIALVVLVYAAFHVIDMQTPDCDGICLPFDFSG